jgi:hypothetical protein
MLLFNEVCFCGDFDRHSSDVDSFRILFDEKQDDYLLPEEVFLRQEKVLDNGQIEFGFSVINRDRSAPLLGADKVRLLIPSLSLRYNLMDDFLCFVKIPYVFSWRELPEDIDYTKNHENHGFGDISFGLNYQLLKESANLPSVMLSLNVKSNTGYSPYNTDINNESIGTGHWQINPGVSFVKTMDPIVLFGGLYYGYTFSRMINKPIEFESDLETVKSSPGDEFTLVFGTGFAPNDKLAMSFKFSGAYILRNKIEEKNIGDIKTPFYLDTTLDYMLSNNNYIEPSFSFGINNDASDLIMSLSYVYGF